MERLHIKTTAFLLLIFFIGLVISYFYQGVITVPNEGDSIMYHIPIAQRIAQGKIFSPNFYLGYYPSNAEAILALLYIFGIPMNIFNVIGLVLLFLVLWKTGTAFGLQSDFALIYSIGLTTLHGIIRWLDTQVIDIWLALFFALTLLVFQTFQPTKKGYFLLGCAIGLLIGTKYSGPLFAVILLLFYYRKFFSKITWSRILVFLIPLLIFGLSWYVRNILLTHNPIYPQPLFNLAGMPGWDIFNIQVWEATILYPVKMINAYFAEFMLWPLILLLVLPYIGWKYHKEKKYSLDVLRLFFIGFINFFIYLFLPTSEKYDIIVSSFRYSYPVFIPLILVLFLYFKKLKKEAILIFIVVSNLAMLPSTAYRPKLVIPLFFIALLIYYNKAIIALIRKK